MLIQLSRLPRLGPKLSVRYGHNESRRRRRRELARALLPELRPHMIDRLIHYSNVDRKLGSRRSSELGKLATPAPVRAHND